jgi:hypothetical protein
LTLKLTLLGLGLGRDLGALWLTGDIDNLRRFAPGHHHGCGRSAPPRHPVQDFGESDSK